SLAVVVLLQGVCPSCTNTCTECKWLLVLTKPTDSTADLLTALGSGSSKETRSETLGDPGIFPFLLFQFRFGLVVHDEEGATLLIENNVTHGQFRNVDGFAILAVDIFGHVVLLGRPLRDTNLCVRIRRTVYEGEFARFHRSQCLDDVAHF